MNTRYRLIFLLMLCKNLLFGQNLVINSGFEDYSDMEHIQDQIHLFYSKDWMIPDESTPDYYNVNSADPSFMVPKNAFGNYSPHSGKAYIGLIPFCFDGYTEHITGKLTHSLKRGEKYIFSMYIRYAGASYFQFARFGVCFSNDAPIFYSWSFGMPDDFYENLKIADIQNDKLLFLNDSTKWVKIESNYMANGGEKFFTIGFFRQIDLDVLTLVHSFSNIQNKGKKKMEFYKKHQEILRLNKDHHSTLFDSNEFPYYFIDDVSLVLDSINIKTK